MEQTRKRSECGGTDLTISPNNFALDSQKFNSTPINKKNSDVDLQQQDNVQLVSIVEHTSPITENKHVSSFQSQEPAVSKFRRTSLTGQRRNFAGVEGSSSDVPSKAQVKRVLKKFAHQSKTEVKNSQCPSTTRQKTVKVKGSIRVLNFNEITPAADCEETSSFPTFESAKGACLSPSSQIKQQSQRVWKPHIKKDSSSSTNVTKRDNFLKQWRQQQSDQEVQDESTKNTHNQMFHQVTEEALNMPLSAMSTAQEVVCFDSRQDSALSKLMPHQLYSNYYKGQDNTLNKVSDVLKRGKRESSGLGDEVSGKVSGGGSLLSGRDFSQVVARLNCSGSDSKNSKYFASKVTYQSKTSDNRGGCASMLSQPSFEMTTQTDSKQKSSVLPMVIDSKRQQGLTNFHSRKLSCADTFSKQQPLNLACQNQNQRNSKVISTHETLQPASRAVVYGSAGVTREREDTSSSLEKLQHHATITPADNNCIPKIKENRRKNLILRAARSISKCKRSSNALGTATVAPTTENSLEKYTSPAKRTSKFKERAQAGTINYEENMILLEPRIVESPEMDSKKHMRSINKNWQSSSKKMRKSTSVAAEKTKPEIGRVCSILPRKNSISKQLLLQEQSQTLQASEKVKKHRPRAESFLINNAEGTTTATGRGTSCNSGNASIAVATNVFASICQVSGGQMEHVPKIKGISRKLLVALYMAKCQDLQINASKQQMIRFFEMVMKNHLPGSRKLNLADMGLGDSALLIVAKILKNNSNWALADLSKNIFTSAGLKALASCIQKSNETLVHVNVGGNHIQTDGAQYFFKCIEAHNSLISIDFSNNDCYKNKVKMGTRGAECLSKALRNPNCLISNLDLTDNVFTAEALNHVVEGVKKCQSLVSLNLSQNDVGQSLTAYTQLLTIFKSKNSLQELNLSQNQLTDKCLDDMAAIFNSGEKLPLKNLNLGSNKFTIKGCTSLFRAMYANYGVSLARLNLDKCLMQRKQSEGPDPVFYQFKEALIQLLKKSKHLTHLSMVNCGIGKDTMLALGQGLHQNTRLQSLMLRGNKIQASGLCSFVSACYENPKLVIRNLDFGSNQLCDKTGYELARCFKALRTLESISLKDNNLANESSDALLYLVKENTNICKCNLELNLIKYISLVEIDKTCAKNKAQFRRQDLPSIRREIRGLRKKRGEAGGFQIDQLNAKLKHQKTQIGENLQEVYKVEEKIEDVRADQIEANKQLEEERDELLVISKEKDDAMADLETEHKVIHRRWQRILEEEMDRIDMVKNDEEKVQRQIKHFVDKKETSKHTQYLISETAKLTAELEKIEKENKMFKIIKGGYVNEIERRKEKIEAAKPKKPHSRLSSKQQSRINVTNADDSDKKKSLESSPLRRAREYAVGCGGSPSKIRLSPTKLQKEESSLQLTIQMKDTSMATPARSSKSLNKAAKSTVKKVKHLKSAGSSSFVNSVRAKSFVRKSTLKGQ